MMLEYIVSINITNISFEVTSNTSFLITDVKSHRLQIPKNSPFWSVVSRNKNVLSLHFGL